MQASLESRLNNAQVLQQTNFSALLNGRYTVTGIRSLNCQSRNGSSFRAVKADIVQDVTEERHSTFLPSHVARVLTDGDIARINRGGITLEKTGCQLAWVVQEPNAEDLELVALAGDI
jgi:hypothetical protein